MARHIFCRLCLHRNRDEITDATIRGLSRGIAWWNRRMVKNSTLIEGAFLAGAVLYFAGRSCLS